MEVNEFYNVKTSKVVKTIYNEMREHYMSAFGNADGNKTPMYIHMVVFEDGFEAECFQRTSVLSNNKEKVKLGDTLTFVPNPGSDPKKKDVIKIFYEPPTQGDIRTSNVFTPEPIRVQGTAITFSTGYAKDIVRDYYTLTGNTPSLDEYVSKIKKIAIDLKENIITNI